MRVVCIVILEVKSDLLLARLGINQVAKVLSKVWATIYKFEVKGPIRSV